MPSGIPTPAASLVLLTLALVWHADVRRRSRPGSESESESPPAVPLAPRPQVQRVGLGRHGPSLPVAAPSHWPPVQPECEPGPTPGPGHWQRFVVSPHRLAQSESESCRTGRLPVRLSDCMLGLRPPAINLNQRPSFQPEVLLTPPGPPNSAHCQCKPEELSLGLFLLSPLRLQLP